MRGSKGRRRSKELSVRYRVRLVDSEYMCWVCELTREGDPTGLGVELGKSRHTVEETGSAIFDVAVALDVDVRDQVGLLS